MEDGCKRESEHKYKWVIFIACFIMLFVALGFGSSTKSTYTKAVTTQLGFERSLYSINDSIRYVSTAIVCFFYEFFYRKLGMKKMVGFGFLSLFLAFSVYSFANTYWHFYIGGALLGIGFAWTASSMASAIIRNWFGANCGTVLGFCLCANGLGGIASEQIISRIIYGIHGDIPETEARWRLAYRFTAILIAVIGIVVLLLLKNPPNTMLKSEGKKKKRGLDWEGMDFSIVAKRPYFYLSGIAIFLTGPILQGMSNIAKPHMYDVGISKEFVIAAFSIHSFVLMSAKILCGISYDHIGLKKTFVWIGGAGLGAMMSLYFINAESTILVYFYSILSSLAMPMETILITLVVSDLFGRKPFNRIYGYFHAASTLGSAAAIPICNFVYDKMGTYKNVPIVLAAIMVMILIFLETSIFLADKDRKKFLEKNS